MSESFLGRLEERRVFKDYFGHADIVVLGEDIEHGSHDSTIMSFIESFGSQLKGIFVEISVSYQPSIDQYLETGIFDERLEDFFSGAEREGKMLKKSLLHLLGAAKERSIKVICYDASKEFSETTPTRARHGYYFLSGECRDEDMFSNVQTMTTRCPGKYLVIIGGHHLSHENFEGDFKNFGERIKEAFGSRCITVRMTDEAHVLDASQSEIFADEILLERK